MVSVSVGHEMSKNTRGEADRVCSSGSVMKQPFVDEEPRVEDQRSIAEVVP